MSELFLYEAGRAQHVKEIIKPLLREKKIILCDRYSDASVAYQGYGRKIPPALVEELNRIVTEGIKPDITFLLDCPPGVGLRRALRRNEMRKQTKEDRFEREKLHFHRRVRRGYLIMARRESDRIRVINTRQGEEQVFGEIKKIIDEQIRFKAFGIRGGKRPRI